MTVCPRCGAQCAEGLRFCGVCGDPLPVQPVTGAAAGAVRQVPAAPAAPVNGPVYGVPVSGSSVSAFGPVPSAAGVPGAAQRSGVVPGWAPAQTPAPTANRPAAVTPVAPVPNGVQEGHGVADPARAWLRGVRAPLVCMLVGAVFGVLNNPLSTLIVAVMSLLRLDAAFYLLAFGLVGGVAVGLTKLMGIALLAPIAGDGRSRKGGAAVIVAFVLAAAYTGCMIARALIRFSMSGADRQALNGLLVWNTIVTVGAGLMSLIMIVLVMVMARSGRSVPVAGPMAVPTRSSGPAKPAKPHAAGARMTILVACIVVVVCDLIVSVLYQGPLSKGAVLGSLYSAVNAIMFVLAVMLPLVALTGRLRETTGVNRHTAILALAAVCALAQVVSVSCSIAELWLADQLSAGAISGDEYHSRTAPLIFVNTVMNVVFYLTIITAVIIMLVAVSKAARGVSGPARPAAYATWPAAYAAPMPAPGSAPAPVPGSAPGYAAPGVPAPQGGYGASTPGPSAPLPQAPYPRR